MNLDDFGFFYRPMEDSWNKTVGDWYYDYYFSSLDQEVHFYLELWDKDGFTVPYEEWDTVAVW